jgi:hypothetical protein
MGGAASPDEDWSHLRRRWEYAHVVRAVLSLSALLLLAIHVAAQA